VNLPVVVVRAECTGGWSGGGCKVGVNFVDAALRRVSHSPTPAKHKKKTTCMLTGPDTTSIQGVDALVHASHAHTPPSGTKPLPTGSGLSGQQNTDTPDVATHAALHV
jgi:hypothetical protein